MQTKARKSIHDPETCKLVSNLRKLLRDANTGAERWSWIANKRTDEWWKLHHAADEYMAAVECYNENPWDRVNVRKYADAKSRLHELLHPQPNDKVSGGGTPSA